MRHWNQVPGTGPARTVKRSGLPKCSSVVRDSMEFWGADGGGQAARGFSVPCIGGGESAEMERVGRRFVAE